MAHGNIRKAKQKNEDTKSSRIDWRHCTILPASVISSVEEDGPLESKALPDDVDKAVRASLAHMSTDPRAPLYIATVDGVLVYVNEGYRDLARNCYFFRPFRGKDGEDLTGKDRLPDVLIAILEEVCLVRRSTTIEENLKVGNAVRYFRSRHFPILNDSGEIIAVGGTYVDCTEQHESLLSAAQTQQRFMDFARASSDWFWEVDRDLVVTCLSERLTALIGTSTFKMIGKPLGEIGKLLVDRNGNKTITRAYQRRTPFRDQILEMEDIKGSRLLFHLSGVPVFHSESGEFTGYRGAGMDVTARYKIEEEAAEVRRNLENTLEELTNKHHQLDVASATAEHALATKNEFLAGMSHELRTPLNAIIGFAEAMKMEVFGDLNDQYVSYSQDIVNAGRHLLGLINDVLDVAVLENNKIKLDPELVPLKEIVDTALNLVVMRANQKGQDTSGVKVAPQWKIYADVRRMTQVMVNLLSNAVKFTPEEGSIGIDVEKTEDGRNLAITVWDTGSGIREAELEMVFEKFHQSEDSVYSRREEGTGLGLHISRQLAELMGGTLTLESEYGHGSRFTVTLPRSRPEA